MKKFKFLQNNETPHLHNGVTNSFLIELSEEILSYSDWIYSSGLHIDTDQNQDSLIIEFMDINGDNYECQIFENLSFVFLAMVHISPNQFKINRDIV